MGDATTVKGYEPTRGLSYDPAEPVYWERKALDGEVHRAFEICNGCRMCFKYCDAFPLLFDLLERRITMSGASPPARSRQ